MSATSLCEPPRLSPAYKRAGAGWLSTSRCRRRIVVSTSHCNRQGDSTMSPQTRRFPADVLAAIDTGKILGIRAGRQPHRVIGIWAVGVEGCGCVRSWSLKPRSWYRTFLADPEGIIVVEDREIPVRAVRT